MGNVSGGGEQVWDFPTIHAVISTLRGHGGVLAAQNDQLSGLLGQGAAIWHGGASDMWRTEQGRLNNRATDFQTAYMQYLGAVEDATFAQEHTEAQNMAMFG